MFLFKDFPRLLQGFVIVNVFRRLRRPRSNRFINSWSRRGRKTILSGFRPGTTTTGDREHRKHSDAASNFHISYRSSYLSTADAGDGGGKGSAGGAGANRSFQRILPVACITTNSVRIEPIVIANPVKPFRKKA